MDLPTKITPEEFDDIYRLKPDLWRGAIYEICAAHGLAREPFGTFADGSNLLASVGGRAVVKIFPPFHRNQWESECRVLLHLEGKIGFPVPRLIAQGERSDGFLYAVLSLLPGRTLERAWVDISESDKVAILHRVGEVMAQVHRVTVGALSDLPPRWNDFLEGQVAGCVARHTRLAAPTWLLRDLPLYLKENVNLLGADAHHVILTGEYTPFNLMVEEDSSGARLSGMIDFGDAMVGPAQYDLLGPLVFLCGGRDERVRALFSGYGYAPGALNEKLRTTLMLLLLLHRYSNPRFQVRVDGWETRASSLAQLSELLFPFGA